MKNLTPKQERFVQEYLIDLNATQAAVRAGYSQKTANEQGSRLLRNVNIRARIDEQLAQIKTERTATAADVMDYLSDVMFGRSTSEVVVSHTMGFDRVQKPPDERERLKAAELLGKRYQLFTDKIEHSGGVQVNFTGDGELAE